MQNILHSKRFEWLDFIRYIAASLVILTHLLEVFIVRKYGFDDPTGVGQIECWIGMISVLCFFILSGYVIAYSIDQSVSRNKFSFSVYFKNRFCRIYPVVWGSILAAFCVIAIMYYFDLPGLGSKGLYTAGDVWSEPNYLSFDYLLYSMTLAPVGFYGGFFNVALWSVSYEFCFYILYGAMIASYIRLGWIRTISAGFIIILVAFTWYEMAILGGSEKSVSLLHSLQLFMKKFPCWNFFTFLSIWSMGVGIYYFCKYYSELSRKFLLFVPLIAIIVAISLHTNMHIPFNFNPYSELSKYSDPAFSVFMLMDYALVMTWGIYIFLHVRYMPNFVRLISVLGKKYSYSLYATHFLLINLLFGIVANKLNQFTLVNYIELFVGIYITANIFAYYFARVFEDRKRWIVLFDKVWVAHHCEEGSSLRGKRSCIDEATQA